MTSSSNSTIAKNTEKPADRAGTVRRVRRAASNLRLRIVEGVFLSAAGNFCAAEALTRHAG